MGNILFVGKDPLPNIHRQTREARRYALKELLESGLRNAYTTACGNLVWTLRRAMLILTNGRGKQVASEIWGLKDLQSMVAYWDCHLAKGTSIPKLGVMLVNGFRKRSCFMDTLDWKSEWQTKCQVVLRSKIDEYPLPHECLTNTSIVIEAADIVASYIENTCKCKNVYKQYDSVKWLDEPPDENPAETDILSL